MAEREPNAHQFTLDEALGIDTAGFMDLEIPEYAYSAPTIAHAAAELNYSWSACQVRRWKLLNAQQDCRTNRFKMGAANVRHAHRRF